MPAIDQIKTWVIQHLEGTLSDDHRIQLTDWMAEEDANRQAVEEFLEENSLTQGIATLYKSRENIWQRLDTALSTKTTTAQKPPHNIFSNVRTWWAAAAILLLLAGSIWRWLPRHPATVLPLAVEAHIPPGGNRATLTLADGQKILLDSAANGALGRQGSVLILKTAPGQVQYQGTDKAVSFNTLTTPRGGQYQLQLPDGTKVWLNAASSITFPTAFTGPERKVTITGEAYFEVADNKSRPFRVNVNEMEITVLGTWFNVNAYADESTMNTSLLQGKVSVAQHDQAVTLAPGQQAQVSTQNEPIRVIAAADVQQAVAWKNGLFSFTQADLGAVMRQLSRWYAIDVTFPEGIPKRSFTGDIGRSLTLDQVLKGLSKTRINYKIMNGNKIVILP